MGKNATHLAGLHSPNGEKMATFRLAKEVFDDRNVDYQYAIMFSNDLEYPPGFYTWINLTVFDVFAHEVSHELDMIIYGSNFGMLGAFSKELSVIIRVNELRFRLGLPLEDWWFTMPKGGK